MIGMNLANGRRMFAGTLRLAARVFVVVALPAITLLTGCGGESTTTVQGTITFNDQPVTTGLINFMPSQGKPFGGAIQSDGTYSYDMPPGEYKVRIDSPPPTPAGLQEGSAVTSNAPSPQAASGRPGQGQVPAQFASYDTSGLTLTVGSESPQQHDFKLP
jgi:hypothetical protein